MLIAFSHFIYRIPEDDEEDVEADAGVVVSSTSTAAMRDGVDKVDDGQGEM